MNWWMVLSGVFFVCVSGSVRDGLTPTDVLRSIMAWVGVWLVVAGIIRFARRGQS